MEYVAPVNGDANDPTRPYQDGDPSLGQVGSIPSARFFNLLMNEGRNLVEGAGLTLDPQDDAQWLAAVRGLSATQKISVQHYSGPHSTGGNQSIDIPVPGFELTHSSVDPANPRLIRASGYAEISTSRVGGESAIASRITLQASYDDGITWTNRRGFQAYYNSGGGTDTEYRYSFVIELRDEMGMAAPRYRIVHHHATDQEVSTIFNGTLVVEEYRND